MNGLGDATVRAVMRRRANGVARAEMRCALPRGFLELTPRGHGLQRPLKLVEHLFNLERHLGEDPAGGGKEALAIFLSDVLCCVDDDRNSGCLRSRLEHRKELE